MLTYLRKPWIPMPAMASTQDDYLDDLEVVASAQDMGARDTLNETIRPGSNRFPDIKWQIKPAFED